MFDKFVLHKLFIFCWQADFRMLIYTSCRSKRATEGKTFHQKSRPVPTTARRDVLCEAKFVSVIQNWNKVQQYLDNQRSNNTQTLKILEKKFFERRTKSRNSGRENSESLGEIQDSEKPNYSKAEYFSSEKYVAYRLQRKLYFAKAKFRSCFKTTRKSLRKNKLSAFWLGLNLTVLDLLLALKQVRSPATQGTTSL